MNYVTQMYNAVNAVANYVGERAGSAGKVALAGLAALVVMGSMACNQVESIRYPNGSLRPEVSRRIKADFEARPVLDDDGQMIGIPLIGWQLKN